MSGSTDVETGSAPDAPPSRSQTAVCRVTVVAPGVEVDLTLPSNVVLASVLPGVVSLIADHRAARGDSADERDSTSTRAPTVTTLAGSTLDAARSLNELGVHDGDLLVLHGGDSVPPPPLFDDVVHAVSSSADRGRWDSDAARTLGSGTALVAAMSGAVSAVLHSNAGVVGGVVAIAVALVLTAVGCAIGTVQGDPRAAAVVCLCAAPVGFVGGMLVVPGTDVVSDCALGAAISGVSALLTLRFGRVGRSTFTTLAVVAVVLCLGCLWGTTTAVPLDDIGAVITGACVMALTWAPRMAMLHSRLPLPRVPVADSSTLFDHTEPAVTASFEAVRSRTAAAQQFLTGYVAGLSIAAAGAALLAASVHGDDGIDGVRIVLACSVAGVLALRGRNYVDRMQAGASIGCGAVVILGLLFAAASSFPDRSVVWSTGFALLAVSALALGVVAPGRSFSPVLRRAAELVEFAAIATVIPLICWVIGLFALVRAL